MKAIGVINASLQDIELPEPTPGPRDLLVRVEAISVNPVDTKMRRAPQGNPMLPRVLGYDAAGTVVAVGSEVTLFQPGQQVYYAGSIVRPGANSELHLVDERIVGIKPASLSMEQAAALPLTSITAWEALFDRLGIDPDGADENKRILIVGGAGGVGSIAIQLAGKVAKMDVIATASREESAAWCRELGADHVVDHHGDIAGQVAALGGPAVEYILCLNDLDQHFPAMAEVIAPQGKICAILGNQRALPSDLMFGKSATLVFELMFTRSTYTTPDMIEQHRLLDEVARLVDEGVLKTTVGEISGGINAANLTRAHAALESGRTIGKIVLAGF